MKVSLVDVDGHHFPNLALMKLSAWHKAQGDTVEWYTPLFSRPDRIYASKVFTFSPDYQDFAASDPEPIKGGTGYDASVKLPGEIENMFPDYSLYPQFTEAYGFLTRGCIRNCPWCVVPRKEGAIRIVGDIEQIRRRGRREVILMDNNFLAAPAAFVAEQCKKIKRLDLRVDFNQGLDARLVTNENAALLAKIRYIRCIRFSADTPHAADKVICATRLLRQHGFRQEVFCYMLIKDDLEEAEERAGCLVRENITPFAQPYRDFAGKSEPSDEQKIFSRYVNIKGGKMVLKLKFKDYFYNGRKVVGKACC